jgi:hypothetical protein
MDGTQMTLMVMIDRIRTMEHGLNGWDGSEQGLEQWNADDADGYDR